MAATTDLERSRFPVGGRTDPIDRHIHSRSSPRFVETIDQVPNKTELPEIFYVVGPPPQLWLTDANGKRELGWSELAAASTSLTLSTSNVDIEGCSVTLPSIGTYIIRGTFDFHLQAAGVLSTGILSAIGVLTDDGDVEVDTPRGAIAEWKYPFDIITNGGMVRVTVTQAWRVTTTTSDEVFKLRARRTDPGSTITIQALTPHTTIVASGFLGGEEGAASHTHTHASTTGRTVDDHHDEDHAPEDHIGTDITATELEDLSDGGATTLHTHAGGGGSGVNVLVFTFPDEDLDAAVFVPRPSWVLLDSHSAPTSENDQRFTVTANVVGAGTNTVVLESTTTSPFTGSPSWTVRATLALNASKRVSTIEFNSDWVWDPTTEYLRVRCSAVNATAPTEVLGYFEWE